MCLVEIEKTPKPVASCAMPLIPKQSGLFGVIAISITFSDLLLK